MEFFHLKMDFKKQSDMADKTLPEWVNVIKKRFDKMENKV